MAVTETEPENQRNRGRDAATPTDIPAKGWRDIMWRVWAALGHDNVSIVAAGVAFYGMLAVFPAITSFVSIYGLMADPADVQAQFASLEGVIPGEAWNLMNDQLTAVAASSQRGLGFGAAIGLLIALWSGGAGIRALMTALNIAYREEEKRSFISFYGTAVLFTLGIVLVGIFSLGVIVVVPVALSLIKLGALTEALIKVAPWLVLADRHYGRARCALPLWRQPRRAPKTRWGQRWSNIWRRLLWLLSSILFSFYVANFASYNQTYGSLGAVVDPSHVVLDQRLYRAARRRTERRDGASDQRWTRPKAAGSRWANAVLTSPTMSVRCREPASARNLHSKGGS